MEELKHTVFFKETTLKPVYNIDEQFKMKVFKVLTRESFLFFKSLFKKLRIKFFFKDFYTLFLFYILLFLLGVSGTVCGTKILDLWLFLIRDINTLTILAFLFLIITSIQLFFFGMWLDNLRLYK